MAEDNTLLEERQELRHQLLSGECRTLIDVLLDAVGRLVQGLTGSAAPPPFWYSALVIALITMSIGPLISLLLGERYPL